MQLSRRGKKLLFNSIVIISLILLTVIHICQKENEKKLLSIYEFFVNTDKIESIVIYNHINNEEIVYNNKDEIQYIINTYKHDNVVFSNTRQIMKRKKEMMYSVKIFLSDAWIEEMTVYSVDKKIYYGDMKASFNLNGKNYILLFRGKVCSIEVSKE